MKLSDYTPTVARYDFFLKKENKTIEITIHDDFGLSVILAIPLSQEQIAEIISWNDN